MISQSSIAIIGTGVVGSTTAYSLMMSNITSKIILVDSNEKRCEGEVQDLSDALSLNGSPEITHGTPKLAGQADIIIIAAGIAQNPGQNRLELLNVNKKIITSIIQEMQPINTKSIIIVVTNPVDILTDLVQKISGLPRNQVFGSGTLLDTQRLRGLIGKKVNTNPASINLYVLGEHGDSQCVAWSCADIGGIPLSKFPGLTQKDLDEMAIQARRKAYDIIACKGSTAFGIAACISSYCRNILLNQKLVVPVSCFIEEFGVCLSMPVILGKTGIENILNFPLNDAERTALERSASLIRKTINETDSN